MEAESAKVILILTQSIANCNGKKHGGPSVSVVSLVTFSGGVIPGITTALPLQSPTVTGHCPDGNPVPALCRKSWPRGPGRGAGGRGDPSPTNLYSSSKYMTRIERECGDVEKRAKDDQIHGHAYD